MTTVFDAMGLEVIVDLAHRQHAGIGLGGEGLALVLDVPVEDAPDERRDQEGAGVGAGGGLGQR